MSIERTEAQLKELILKATLLKFWDDVFYWEEELKKLKDRQLVDNDVH